MNVEEIRNEYTVKDGIIQDCGKFEGEPIHTVYFYDLVMDGAQDDTIYDEYDDAIDVFDLTREDYEMFPELVGYKQIQIAESEQGFVHCYYVE